MKIIHYSEVDARNLSALAHGVSGRVVIGKADGANNFYMRVIELSPGGHIPLHNHIWEHEQFVHSGRGEIRKGEEWVEIGPGSVLFIPGDEGHEIRNTGDEPLVIVCLIPSYAPEL